MLSYSSIVNSGKVTLPSVETWGTNMNIQRDPPKSIMTRRRDKVGENSDMLKMIDNSDRSSEAILRFARGVNPSVTVSFSNNGGSLQNYGNQQARLPYTINKDGDFHPPVHAPQDLLPLSRLPRNITSAVTNPTLPHFGKELPNSRNTTVTSALKKIISSQVVATKRYFKQKPFQEAFETNYMIQPVLKKSATSSISTTDRTQLNVQQPTKEVNNDVLNVFANSNVSDNYKYIGENNNLDTTRFLQDPNAHSVFTNLHDVKGGVPFESDLSNGKTKDYTLIEYTTPLNSNGQTKYIQENFELDRNLPLYASQTNNMGLNNGITYLHNNIELQKTLPNYESRTNIVSNNSKSMSYLHDDLQLDRVLPLYNTKSNIKGTGEYNNYIHKDLELQRTLPEYQSKTNIKETTQKTLEHEYMKELDRKSYLSNMSTNNNGNGENNITNRDYILDDKLQYGEFMSPGNIPTFERNQDINMNFESEKSKMGKLVSAQFHGKYN